MVDEAIVTNVGAAGIGHNVVRGHSVRDDLLPRGAGFWSAMALNVGARLLDEDESRYLDALAVANIASDPRIWPLKLTWLIGAYGSFHASLAAATVYFDDAIVGPPACRGAAKMLGEIAALKERDGDLRAVGPWLAEQKAAGVRLPGVGVPGREVDERSTAIKQIVARFKHEDGAYFRLLAEVEPVMNEAIGMGPNVGSVLAACLLDLGMTAEQVGHTTTMMALLQIIGHAAETAERQPQALWRLDRRRVRYEGPAPRRSRRAEEEAP